MKTRLWISLLLLLAFARSVSAQSAEPTLSLTHSSGTVDPNEIFTVDVTVSAAAALAGVEFDLRYDAEKLQLLDYTLTGALGSGAGCDAASNRCAVALNLLDLTAIGDLNSTTAIGAYSYGNGAALTGDATIGTLQFQAQELGGATSLQIRNALFADDAAATTTPATNDLALTVFVPTNVKLQSGESMPSASYLVLILLLVATLLFITRRSHKRRWLWVVPLVLLPLLSIEIVSAAPSMVAVPSTPRGAIEGINPDVNGDRLTNITDLQLLATLFDVTSSDSNWNAAYDLNENGVIDSADLILIANRWRIGLLGIAETSPSANELAVALTRETIVKLAVPLDPSSVATDTIRATFAGSPLDGWVNVSADNQTLTRFHSNNLPASSRVRVAINGDGLVDAEGYALDIDGDGLPGGTRLLDFSTVSITAIPGTSVCGDVFASDQTQTSRGLTDEPLVGVTISVDGAEDTLFTTTDANGHFCLDPAPLGRFFIHVDGGTATNTVPAGAYYPFVGKAWESVAGQQTDVGNIFLPIVAPDTLQMTSAVSDTVINFAQSVIDGNPDFADVAITVPADSLFADDSTRGGMVGIAPVPPDRLPGTLPNFLNFPLVITVQTDGATNFDDPAPICFPNLPDPTTGQSLPANSKSALHSFNHDSGAWSVVGPMTVSADGTLVCTDAGVGILAPGWHGSQPGAKGFSPPGAPDTLRDCPKDIAFNINKYRLSCTLNGSSDIGGLLTRETGDASRDLEVNEILNAMEKSFDNNRALLDVVGRGRDCIDRLNACLEQFSPGFPPVFRGVERTGLLFNSGLQSTVIDDWPLAASAALEEMVMLYTGVLDDLEAYLDLYEQILVIYDGASSQSELTPAEVAQATVLAEQAFAILDNQTPQAYFQTSIDRIIALGAQIDAQIGVLNDQPRAHYLLVDETTGEMRRGRTEPGGAIPNLILALDSPYTLYKLYPPDNSTPDDSGRTRSFVNPPRMTLARFEYLAAGGCLPTPPDRFVQDEDYPEDLTAGEDLDGDGLDGLTERILGTNPNSADADGDGIDDGAELVNGTDPTDGILVVTGVVASAETTAADGTPAPALDVCGTNDAIAVALGEDGVALFDVNDGANPILRNVVDTPGNASRVACVGATVAVADGASGLALIDVSDPATASIVQQVDLFGAVTAVAAQDTTVFVGTDAGQVTQVDLISGAVLGRKFITNNVTDVGINERYLYAIAGNNLHTVDTQGDLTLTATTNAPTSFTPHKRLFVGDGFAHAVYGRGFNSFDLSDPAQPVLAGGGSTGQLGWRHMVANGSGLGVAAVGPNGGGAPRNVSLYDLSDPSATPQFLAEFATPGLANAVTIYNGLAYVADDLGGLQVVNYRSADTAGNAPTITLDISNTNGNSIEEGKLVAISAETTDDVQIRNVEFLINGQRQTIDGSFPFNFSFVAPTIASARGATATLTIEAIATDTGLNATSTGPLIFTLTPDAQPPSVTSVAPLSGTVRPENSVTLISAQFDEPLANATLDGNITLVEAGADGLFDSADDTQIPFTLQHLLREKKVNLTLDSALPIGNYRLTITAAVSDLAGNSLLAPYVSSFRVGPEIIWTGNGSDSFWTNPANWLGTVPTANDIAIIDLPGNYLVHVRGLQTVGALYIENPNTDFLINGSFNDPSILTVNGEMVNAGVLRMQTSFSGEPSNLTVHDGLINVGVIRSISGSGGPRVISADVENYGTFDVVSIMTLGKADGVFNNFGEIDIDQFDTLKVDGGGTFLHQDGRLIGTGTLLVMAGSSLTLNAVFSDTAITVEGGALTFADGVQGTSLVKMRDTSTLSGDIPAGIELLVQGLSDRPGVVSAESSFTNYGYIRLTAAANFGTGSATLNVNGTLLNQSRFESTPGNGNGRTLNADIDNRGEFILAYGLNAHGVISNNGTITIALARALSVSTELRQLSGSITGPGTLDFKPGATFDIASGVITDTAVVIRDGTLNFPTGLGSVTTPILFRLRGNTTLSGDIQPDATILVDGRIQNPAVVTAPTSFTNYGLLRLVTTQGNASDNNHTTLTVASGGLNNQGTLLSDVGVLFGTGARTINANIDNGGLLDIDRNTTLTGNVSNSGVIDLASGKALIVIGDSVDNSGLLIGGGVLDVSQSAFSNNGTVSPGSSPGLLSVTGNMTNTTGSELLIEIQGTTVGSGYDRLAVSDDLILTGTLDITLTDGFTPSLGQAFTVVTCDSCTDQFATINGIQITPTLRFEVVYSATDVQLIVVEDFR